MIATRTGQGYGVAPDGTWRSTMPTTDPPLRTDPPEPDKAETLLVNPAHPCQTPHKSFSTHHWIAVWEGGVMTTKHRCTTCGTVEEAGPLSRQ